MVPFAGGRQELLRRIEGRRDSLLPGGVAARPVHPAKPASLWREGALLVQHDAAPSTARATFRRCPTRLAYSTSTTGPGNPAVMASRSYADDSPKGFKRARRWYGPELDPDHGLHGGEPHGKGVQAEGVRPESRQVWGGLSSSAAVSGALVAAFDDLDPSLEVTYLTLEFGTRPILEVLGALRADSWLHACPDRATHLPRPDSAARMQEAFYVDTPAGRPRCTEGPPISF